MIANLSLQPPPSIKDLPNSGEYAVPTTTVSSRNLTTESNMAVAGAEGGHHEAYYLYFAGSVGMLLNIVVVVCILTRRTLRKLTSAFLIHCCCLNFVKCLFCIIFGMNLLAGKEPSTCRTQAAAYIVIITASAFNLVAMICTEAYTFGETNIGGTSRGTMYCILFGILTVYIASTTLHLGPTLIGGYFEFNPQIGSCSFQLGSTSGYIAHVMWIVILSLALMGAIHFLRKFYKEIQLNQPNRVSMLVRTSITIMDEAKQTASSIRELVEESTHRAKIFVLTSILYVVCWYPLFILILIDFGFHVSPKVYQTFSFLAWTHSMLEPAVYILFDWKLNILARFVYCDQYKKYNREQIAYLMSQHRQPSRPNSANMETSDNVDGRLSMDHHQAIDNRLPAGHHVPIAHRLPIDSAMAVDDRLRTDPSRVVDRPAVSTMERVSTLERVIQCRHCKYQQQEYDRQSASPVSITAREEKGLGDSDHNTEVQC